MKPWKVYIFPDLKLWKVILISPSIGVYTFVILKNGVKVVEEEVITGLKELVKKKIAAFAVPNSFLVI